MTPRCPFALLPLLACIAGLSAVDIDPPEVPNPWNTSEARALRDCLLENYQTKVPATTTLDELRVMYSTAWNTAQAALLAKGAGADPRYVAAQEADERQRLEARLRSAGTAIPPQATLAELRKLAEPPPAAPVAVPPLPAGDATAVDPAPTMPTLWPEIGMDRDAYIKLCAAFDRDVHKLQERTFVDAWKQHGQHGAWDATALAAIMSYIDRVGERDFEAVPPSLVLAAQALQQGCTDPLIRYIALRVKDPTPSQIRETIDVVEDMARVGYGPEVQIVAIRRAVGSIMAHDLADQRIDPLLKQLTACAEPLLARGTDLPMAFQVIHFYQLLTDSAKNASAHRKMTQAMLDACSNRVSPWWSLMITGSGELSAAWDARSAKRAKVVREEQWQGFAEHLAKARQAFTQAMAMEPGNPFAATFMITVSMGDNPREMVQWFSRAMRGNPCPGMAIRRLATGFAPRWHGNIEMELALAVACVGTEAWTTSVPEQAMFPLTDAMADSREHLDAFWSINVVWSILDQLTAHATQRWPGSEDQQRRRRLAYAWRCGQQWEAVKLYRKIGAAALTEDSLIVHLDWMHASYNDLIRDLRTWETQFPVDDVP